MGGSSLNPVKAVKKFGKNLAKGISSAGSSLESGLRSAGRKIEPVVNPVMHYNKAVETIMKPFMPQMPDLTQPDQQYIAPDEEALAAARRRRRKSGSATIMSSGTDTLGG